MAIVYITIQQAVDIHERTVAVSGGGIVAHLDIARLESVLEHIQNDDYYPTFEDKLTHLFFSTNKFHCFQDGNKRLALSLGAQFLLLNGYVFITTKFLREMENISYHVAAGSIGKDLLKEIISALVNGDEDNEVLKLKVLNAIQSQDT
ncbi:Death-on-curing family protein [Desulfosarcina cetonica]|uniref:type II toxin-antitoxin system death-on-curing family toxin n=1 Tax=Desulfosarcina cetonica TaxID=90730 RepID=UPI0006D266C5|nr:type II toxin-antitoxin system death-on-curing family toxin [Desulfosarcina cetonica]VTR65200.1 Death-on-curing family protein [Desulfosarcina cetonica]